MYIQASRNVSLDRQAVATIDKRRNDIFMTALSASRRAASVTVEYHTAYI